MPIFDAVSAAPPDAILGLTEAFKADANPAKINLAVGVYKDEAGRTPVLNAVKAAEQRLVEHQDSKSYMPIDGDPAYGQAARELLFGVDHTIVTQGRAKTCNTPGGTGALRMAGDYLQANHPNATLWLSKPTWANHRAIFESGAGLKVQEYGYYDAATFGLDAEAMLGDLANVAAGDVVLLHGCCHNPTGVDLQPEHWQAVGQLLAQRGALPLVDFAYQGFGDGVEQDAAGLRTLCEQVDELLICSSFSKNFGLYQDRVGALTVVAATPEAAGNVQSQVKKVVRRNYSNPPAHGAWVVSTILGDETLTAQWLNELATMRDRINAIRSDFAAGLDQRGVKLSPAGNGFIAQQRGMFSYSGLSKEQVASLRDDHSVYVVGDGRINVAGITPTNLDALCDAIAAVAG